jgi:hypothetical protein
MTTTHFKNNVGANPCARPLLIVAAILLTISCGGGSNQQGGNASATSETAKVETKANDYANQATWTKLSADDYQKVVKANYDFDLTVPSGWSFHEGEKTGVNPAYYVNFTTQADDFKAASQALHQYWFDLTANIIPADGNFEISMEIITNDKGDPIGRKDVKGNRFTELTLNKFIDRLQPQLWYFNTPKGAVQLDFTSSEKAKMVQISLIYMGKKAE